MAAHSRALGTENHGQMAFRLTAASRTIGKEYVTRHCSEIDITTPWRSLQRIIEA